MILLFLACSQSAPPPAESAAPPAAPAPAAPATPSAPKAEVGDAADAALADHWLVILASNEDPAQAVPALDLLKGHPEVQAHPRQILSSRFKNLMPCYAVTIADALPEKKAALALSAQLRALGVDNYVKNAGAWVGENNAIDAWCARGEAPPVGEVRVGSLVDGALWVPVATTDAELASLLAGAPAPEPRGEGYAAWIQPVGSPASGAKVRAVDVRSGATQVCTAGAHALLTLGTPHFGTLQAESPPTAPSCGSPAHFERLDCPQPVEQGRWVVLPEAAAVAAWTPAGEGSAALKSSAEALLRAKTGFGAPGSPEEGVSRVVRANLWKGPAGEVVVVEGTREEGPGVCGGDVRTWYGVFAVAGDSVGAPMGGFQEGSFVEVDGLLDIGADGKPDVVTTAFPESVRVQEAGGAESAAFAVDYCDCPC